METFKCVVHTKSERLVPVTVEAKDKKSARKKARAKFKRGMVNSVRFEN